MRLSVVHTTNVTTWLQLRNAQRSGNGKIASRLEEQKRKTQNQHLVEASRENAAQREERPVWD